MNNIYRPNLQKMTDLQSYNFISYAFQSLIRFNPYYEQPNTPPLNETDCQYFFESKEYLSDRPN